MKKKDEIRIELFNEVGNTGGWVDAGGTAFPTAGHAGRWIKANGTKDNAYRVVRIVHPKLRKA